MYKQDPETQLPSLGPRRHAKLSCGLTNQNFKFFLEIMHATSSGLKKERDHPVYYQSTIQKSVFIMEQKCISAHGLAPSMQNKIYRVWSNICYQPGAVFFMESLAFTKKHSTHKTTTWLCSKRVRVLKTPACSPELSHTKTFCHVINRKILLSR